MSDLISRQAAIDAIVKLTNCNTPKDLREYVAEHSLWSLWSGGVLEALEAVECLPPTPLYTPDEIQTMQDLEWAQMEKMHELGKAEALQRTQMSLTKIIRCKDCRHGIDYYHEGDCYCSNPKWGLTYFGGSWEFYCGDAERREDERNDI